MPLTNCWITPDCTCIGLHSPSPVIPSSVKTRTKIERSSTVYARTSVIFMALRLRPLAALAQHHQRLLEALRLGLLALGFGDPLRVLLLVRVRELVPGGARWGVRLQQRVQLGRRLHVARRVVPTHVDGDVVAVCDPTGGGAYVFARRDVVLAAVDRDGRAQLVAVDRCDHREAFLALPERVDHLAGDLEEAGGARALVFVIEQRGEDLSAWGSRS